MTNDHHAPFHANQIDVCIELGGRADCGEDRRPAPPDEIAQGDGTAGGGIVPLIPKTHAFDNTMRGRFTTADFVYDAERDRYTCPEGKHLTRGKARSDRRQATDIYRNLEACQTCPLKPRCTPERLKRVKRMAGDDVLEKMQARLEHMPDAMAIRRQTVEHPFATLKAWMGVTPFLTKRLSNVKTEMALRVLAHNLKRMINIFGTTKLIDAISG
jgi:hypothetical protein